MERITFEQYRESLKIVKAYEKQLLDDKLKVYDGCTKDDLFTTEGQDFRKNHVWYFWVTKSKEVPDRNADGTITRDVKAGFYCLENSHVPYKTYGEAKSNMLKTFKRKGYIK